jgi:L-alanine-DL-glutamate epimerase-like enolase superfamily enzyme
MIRFSAHLEDWELRRPFRIAGAEWRSSPTLVVQLESGGVTGQGEAQGVYYLDETCDSMLAQVEQLADQVSRGLNRAELQHVLPPGGARNALDCAMWDLECKTQGKSIWQLTGIQSGTVTSVFTIGLEREPEEMAAKAARAARYPVLKIKLDADRPLERLRAIRTARPNAELVVDANQGWSFELLQDILPACQELRLGMIEQPLPRGEDAQLEGFQSPVLLAADESCLHCGELETAARRYGMINIKLDKTGGLTEALQLARAARELGCRLMVGNMVGTSLGMAPAFVVAQLCDFVDIDGPLLLKYDRPFGLQFHNGQVSSIDPRLWG